MKLVDILVEFPSGMTIADRGSYAREPGKVYVSERLAAILREFSITEAPAVVTARIDGVVIVLDGGIDGAFAVGAGLPPPRRQNWLRLPIKALAVAWTKDQRQRFGRFCHSLTVASLAGLIGYWHSLDKWSAGAILNLAALLLIIVITFLEGMDSMNGE